MTAAAFQLRDLIVLIAAAVTFSVWRVKNHPRRRVLEDWARREGYWLDDSTLLHDDSNHTDFRVRLRPRPNAFGVPWVPPPERDANDAQWLTPRTGRARVHRDGTVRLDLDV
jgi:hypothetical protein